MSTELGFRRPECLVQVSSVIWDPYPFSSNSAAASVNGEDIYTGYLVQVK